MAQPDIRLLGYDYSAALIPGTGLDQQQISDLAPRLDAARNEVVHVDQQLFDGGQQIPTEKQPLDAGFYLMPERILEAYNQDRAGSELGRILQTASRLRETVDRVVVLGIGGSYMGARALMEACCHPYHNQLNRAQRGGRPGIYFEGNNVDNDSMQGLLELLRAGDWSQGVEQRWAIIVISKSGGTLETAVAFRTFLNALQQAAGPSELPNYVVPITGTSGKLFDLAGAIGCPELFHVPDGVGGRFSVLSPVGLLPAAVMGLDVVRLLEGAAAMNEHFRTAAPADNLVLNYTAVGNLADEKLGMNLRVLSAWANSLEATGLWYDQLLAESLGKAERGATPLTVVNTRDLHSRAQQHQEGCRDKLITNLIVRNWRCDPVAVTSNANDQDRLNAIAGKTVPEIMTAAVTGTNQAYREVGRPTADLSLPAVDEATIGQLMQMLMLATVVEGRLMGINPYGQPGVEAYKRHMMKHLGLA